MKPSNSYTKVHHVIKFNIPLKYILPWSFLFPSICNSLEISAIEKQLKNEEGRFSDIVENTEKTIVWANGIKKTEFSVVYLHGFSATRQEIHPVTEMVAEKLQANVFYTRLRGHGRSSDAMAEATTEDWLSDTKQAYEIASAIGEKVILLSTSTGSTLAAWLSAQAFADNLFASIMVSPNFAVKNKGAYLLTNPLGLKLGKLINGPYNSFTPTSEVHDKYWTDRYPLEALIPMVQLLRKVKQIDKSKIVLPHLVVYSPNDQIIEPKAAIEFVQQLGNSRSKLVKFNNSSDKSNHVLAGDACSPNSTNELVAVIDDYIEKLMSMN